MNHLCWISDNESINLALTQSGYIELFVGSELPGMENVYVFIKSIDQNGLDELRNISMSDKFKASDNQFEILDTILSGKLNPALHTYLNTYNAIILKDQIKYWLKDQ